MISRDDPVTQTGQVRTYEFGDQFVVAGVHQVKDWLYQNKQNAK